MSNDQQDSDLTVEFRPLVGVGEGGAKYEGEWIPGTKIKHGKGCLI